MIIGVRFTRCGKIYYFDGSSIPDLKIGDHVVVETARGIQIGLVAQADIHPENLAEGAIKPVERLATPVDLLQKQAWQSREARAVEMSATRARELNLDGVKIVGAEYSFDGSRLTISYSTSTDEKVDLKSLRQDMQRQFMPSMVEVRQIGLRDVARVISGLGACGLETRCCARFLTEFCSISIRMAKEQGVSLTPGEITGMCGRLRCCLNYEYEHYMEARQNLPRRNKRVMTPNGEGKVVDVMALQRMVIVDLVEGGKRVFHADDLKDLLGNPISAPEESEPAGEESSPVETVEEPVLLNPVREQPAKGQPRQPQHANPQNPQAGQQGRPAQHRKNHANKPKRN